MNKLHEAFKKINKEIISFQDSSKGVDQEVYIVTCTDGKYVYKSPHKELHKLDCEQIGCQLAKEVSLLAPIVIDKGDSYLIETCVLEKPLYEYDSLALYEQAGKEIRKIHQMEAPYFGEIGKSDKKDPFTAFEEGMGAFILEMKEKLPEIAEEIDSYFNEKKELLKNLPCVYVHGDLGSDHIYSDGERITGFIDFGDLRGAHPGHDLACMYIDTLGGKYFDAFMKGYGTYSFDLIQLEAAIRLTWMLPSHFEHKKNQVLFEKHVSLYKEIIKGK